MKIGRFSFADYAACVLEGLSALEKVEVGELNGWSNNFQYALLRVRSGRGERCDGIDLPKLKSVVIGGNAFQDCSQVQFESG